MLQSKLDQDAFDNEYIRVSQDVLTGARFQLRFGPGLVDEARAIDLPEDTELCACVVDVMANEWDVHVVYD